MNNNLWKLTICQVVTTVKQDKSYFLKAKAKDDFLENQKVEYYKKKKKKSTPTLTLFVNFIYFLGNY